MPGPATAHRRSGRPAYRPRPCRTARQGWPGPPGSGPAPVLAASEGDSEGIALWSREGALSAAASTRRAAAAGRQASTPPRTPRPRRGPADTPPPARRRSPAAPISRPRARRAPPARGRDPPGRHRAPGQAKRTRRCGPAGRAPWPWGVPPQDYEPRRWPENRKLPGGRAVVFTLRGRSHTACSQPCGPRR